MVGKLHVEGSQGLVGLWLVEALHQTGKRVCFHHWDCCSPLVVLSVHCA